MYFPRNCQFVWSPRFHRLLKGSSSVGPILNTASQSTTPRLRLIPSWPQIFVFKTTPTDGTFHDIKCDVYSFNQQIHTTVIRFTIILCSGQNCYRVNWSSAWTCWRYLGYVDSCSNLMCSNSVLCTYPVYTEECHRLFPQAKDHILFSNCSYNSSQRAAWQTSEERNMNEFNVFNNIIVNQMTVVCICWLKLNYKERKISKKN
jgi:hypothetical protein